MTSAGGTPHLRAALSRVPDRLRPLVVLALVAGVLAMHALTVGHQPSPALSAASSAAASVGVMHDTGHRSSGVAAGMTTRGPADSDSADHCAGCGHDGRGSSHAGSHLLGLCVAVLLAGALTLLLFALRGRRRGLLLRAFRPVVISRGAASRRPRPPSLSQLCVLRT